ncbi:MAG TPA: hypothetical protein VG268_22295 [Streptosporangiaceae bacterium]|nr:hypothetical protein [Streptosporangiaceae bacterium]
MRKRALRIAVPVVAACLVAGSIFAFFAGSGSLSGGEWKTASGVSLQVPTDGVPKLVFTTQPAAGEAIQAAGGVFTVTVAIQDRHGTTVSSDSADTVTLALGRDPAGGKLRCTDPGKLTATVSLGRATFAGCSISHPGHGYRLTATSSVRPALAPPANGHSFDVVSAAAAKAAAKAAARTAALKAAATGQSRGAAAGGRALVPGPGGTAGPATPATGAELVIDSPAVTGATTASPVLGPLTVELVTGDGTPVTTGITVQLSSSSGGISEFSASSGGSPATSVVIPPGASAVTFYYGDEVAGQPVITVTAAGAATATQTETVTAGPAAGLSFTGASAGNGRGSHPADLTCSGTVGSSFSCTLSPAPPRGKSRFMTAQVELIDQFQNVVTSTGASGIDVALSQTGGSSLSTGTVSIPPGSSSSAPFTENLGDGGGQGTVSATATLGSAQATAGLTS